MSIQLKKVAVTVASGLAVASLGFTSLVTPSSAKPKERAADTSKEIVFPDGVTVSRDAGTGLTSPNADPNSASRSKVIPCSRGYVCLYENDNFGGRRLQWSKRGTRISNLGEYGFNDRMTSWINNGQRSAAWYNDINFKGGTHRMNASTRNSNVGRENNDKASSLAIF
jgi:hypothetical protein